MRNEKPKDEKEEFAKVYPLPAMQILAMSEKAVVVLETWLENEKGVKKEDENAETGIVPGIDPVIGTGIVIETGIGIGIEIGIGIGIVTIVEDHVLDQETVMDIEDAISIARGQGTVVVPAPKTEAIENDLEVEVVRNVVQRANDHQTRMPLPTMSQLVITKETELSPR